MRSCYVELFIIVNSNRVELKNPDVAASIRLCLTVIIGSSLYKDWTLRHQHAMLCLWSWDSTKNGLEIQLKLFTSFSYFSSFKKLGICNHKDLCILTSLLERGMRRGLFQGCIEVKADKRNNLYHWENAFNCKCGQMISWCSNSQSSNNITSRSEAAAATVAVVVVGFVIIVVGWQ